MEAVEAAADVDVGGSPGAKGADLSPRGRAATLLRAPALLLACCWLAAGCGVAALGGAAETLSLSIRTATRRDPRRRPTSRTGM